MHSFSTASCDDGSECTVTDTCLLGTCAGSTSADGTSCSTGACESGVCVDLCVSVTCQAPDDCHVAGSCNVHTGDCSGATAKTNGTSCDEETGTCQDGTCVANP